MEKQEQRKLAVLMTTLAVLITFMLRQYVCRLRNRHEPNDADVDRFLDGNSETLATTCETCECDLELRSDPDDKDLYWIVEL